MPRKDTPETPDGSNVSAEPLVEPAKAQRYLRHDEYIATDFGRVIIPDNDEETINGIAKILSRKRETELDIAQSKVGGYILSDRVFSVVKNKGSYSNVIVYHGKIKVIIPGHLFFTKEFSVDRCNREIDRRIGSKIDYIIRSYEKNETGDIVVALGSRVDAMRAKAAIWFTGANGDAPKLAAGDITQARVVSEHDYGVVVETGGVETFVRYTPGMEPARKGDPILVRINTINKTEDGEITFSATQFTNDGENAGVPSGDFAVNSKCHGIVSGVTNDGIFIDLGGGVSCYSRFSAKNRPAIGQSVSVTITGQAKKGFLFAKVTHIG